MEVGETVTINKNISIKNGDTITKGETAIIIQIIFNMAIIFTDKNGICKVKLENLLSRNDKIDELLDED